MQYYKVQYHNKDEHSDNWYDYDNDRYDTESEAYQALLIYLQQKFTVFAYVAVDQFRIVFVKEEEIYTTWRLDAESGR